jgi:hypothetical protein
MSMTTTLPSADCTPAITLRERLAECRDRGFKFDRAWRYSLEIAVAGAPAPERVWYRDMLTGQRTTWRNAYLGVGAASPICGVNTPDSEVVLNVEERVWAFKTRSRLLGSPALQK